MNSKNISLFPLLGIACTGCITPHVDETQPTFVFDESWKSNKLIAEATEEHAIDQKWWEIFQDNTLNGLISEALQNSPTIEKALARFDEVTAFATIAGADQFPQLSLNGYGDRRRLPKAFQTTTSVPTANLITPTTPAAIPTPNTGVPPALVPTPTLPQTTTIKSPMLVNDLIANFLISYELDFWGKYYLRTQAANRRLEASAADLETAKLLLVDQVASTYFSIQARNAELAYLRKEIEVHSKRISLLELQCEKGLTPSFQLIQEHATIQEKKSEEQVLIRENAANRALLAVLIGRQPNGATFEIGLPQWTFPVIPPGLPSSILAKRPDIRSSMKNVDALIAEIGAAKTELLPAFSLSAAAGFQADRANQWFKWKNRIWALAGSVAQPIFDAGMRRAEVEAAQARFREAAAVLTDSVLSSIKEVEDALSLIQTQKERCNCAEQKEKDLFIISTLREELHAEGIQDLIIVLQAQEDLIQAKRARVFEDFNLQLGTLSLMKSVGGSF